MCASVCPRPLYLHDLTHSPCALTARRAVSHSLEIHHVNISSASALSNSSGICEIQKLKDQRSKTSFFCNMSSARSSNVGSRSTRQRYKEYFENGKIRRKNFPPASRSPPLTLSRCALQTQLLRRSDSAAARTKVKISLRFLKISVIFVEIPLRFLKISVVF